MTTKIQTFGGNIGIGTNDPGNFKLNVHGSLKTNSLVVNGVTDAQVPIGLIQLWYGSSDSIPSGWALCDGDTYTRTDGGGSIATPDLREKFIRGASGDAPSPLVVGTTGGQNTASLSAANLAPHSHGVTVDAGNANHGHGTTVVNNAPHDHSLAANNTTHGHNTSENNANHNHVLSQQNCNHSHPSYASGGASHKHNTLNTSIGEHGHTRQQRGFIPGPKSTFFPFFSGIRLRPQWTNTFVNTDVANVPHSHTMQGRSQQTHRHNGNASNMNHSHEVYDNNTEHSHTATGDNQMPHSHTLGQGGAQHSHPAPAVDAPHSHTASSNNAGEGTSFSVLNTYYALFYIMKI